jgi:hypothetical protein
VPDGVDHPCPYDVLLLWHDAWFKATTAPIRCPMEVEANLHLRTDVKATGRHVGDLRRGAQRQK